MDTVVIDSLFIGKIKLVSKPIPGVVNDSPRYGSFDVQLLDVRNLIYTKNYNIPKGLYVKFRKSLYCAGDHGSYISYLGSEHFRAGRARVVYH